MPSTRTSPRHTRAVELSSLFVTLLAIAKNLALPRGHAIVVISGQATAESAVVLRALEALAPDVEFAVYPAPSLPPAADNHSRCLARNTALSLASACHNSDFLVIRELDTELPCVDPVHEAAMIAEACHHVNEDNFQAIAGGSSLWHVPTLAPTGFLLGGKTISTLESM